MVFIKKVLNSDSGDADHWGGNDVDLLDDYHDDVDITPKVAKINTETRVRSGKFKFRDTGNDHNYTHIFSNLGADRNVNWPLLGADDQVTFDNHITTLKNKTIDDTNSLNIGAIADNAITYSKLPSVSASKLLGRGSAGGAGNAEEITLGTGLTMSGTTLNAAGGAGGGDVTTTGTQTLTNKTIDIETNSLILRENSYLIFRDGSTYYARNGTTGALTSNSNFRTLIQAIIDTIATRDDTVFTKIKIAPGNYEVNSTINLNDKYNISIEGSGMGITRIQAGATLGSTQLLTVYGSVSGTGKNLTSNTTAQSKNAVMSSGDASTFSVGDWVLVRSTKNFGVGGSADGAQGEIKQIASISSGTITFREMLFDTYATADTANIIKLLPMRNISLSNFTIIPHSSYNPAGDGIWCKFFFVDRMSLDKIETVDYPGLFGGCLQFMSCTNARVSNCHLQQNIAYNFQYGISFHSACQGCTVTNCTAYGDWRHPFEAGAGEVGTNQQGVCRNIVFTNCTATGGSQNCFDTHPEGEGIHFVNCSVLGTNDGGGIKLRSKNSSIVGCKVQGTTQSAQAQHAIMISDDAAECLISGCQIINNNSDGIKIKDGLDGTTVEGCIIQGNSGDGIHIDTGGANRTMIRNNNIIGNTGDGVECLDVDNAIFSGNRISTNGGYGIRFEAATCTNEVIVANSFASNTSGQVLNGGQTGEVKTGNLGY